jgi:hypothetical protein
MHRNTHNTLVVGALTFALCLCSSATAETVRFIVTSDARGYPGYAEVLAAIKAVGDERERDNKKRADFMITPGDMDPLVETEQQIATAFGSGFEWYPVMGNHEKEDSGSFDFLRVHYQDNVQGRPTVNPGPFGSGGTTYSFDKGPVHFVILDVYWNGEPDDGAGHWFWDPAESRVQPELLMWLKKDLRDSNEQRWKLLFFHPPAYLQPDQDLTDPDQRILEKDPLDDDDKVAEFWQVLEDYCVTACFVSHTHRYSAFIPQAGSRVWQLDSAMARGPEADNEEEDEEDEDDDEDDEEEEDDDLPDSAYDTFFIVEADDTKITVDVYRRLYDENITRKQNTKITNKYGKTFIRKNTRDRMVWNPGDVCPDRQNSRCCESRNRSA